jgi:hypothetical protein
MRRLRPHLTYANVMVTLLAIGALTGGVAYAADTIGSSDIIDESILSQDIKNAEVKTADIGNNQVLSADVRDGVLNDEDLAQVKSVDFSANIGPLFAHECTFHSMSTPGVQGDHILLTPSGDDTNGALIYSAQYDTDSDNWLLEACNVTDATVDDGTSHFNLLVIDAQ